MAFIVLDTDVASRSFKDQLSESMASRIRSYKPCITYVTLGEMTRWAQKRNLGTRARTALVHWIGDKVVVPYDTNVATRWGRVMAEGDISGRTRPVNDTWIAVCCLEAGLPLATNNVKDFADLVEREGLKLITA